MRVGYPCICLSHEELRCGRTVVLRNASPERLDVLIRENIAGLAQILRWNESREFRLFRLPNAFIPFASHPVNELRWWEEHGAALREVGDWARAHGHRLSFHASHFTILNSASPPVVEASLADIAYMGRVLEAMGLGPEHKIILHLGITTPTAGEAQDRLERALERVAPEHRRHLALENDDRLYAAEAAVAMGHRLRLPVVVDVLHHACLPGKWGALSCAELLERVFETWDAADGPPKIHFSSQDPDKRPGAHAYWVDPEELERFLAGTRGVRRDFDIMFESKGKDEAVSRVAPVFRSDPRFTRGPAESLLKNGIRR